MKQHIIVGSGLTGMAAALLLKKQLPNDEIIILEAQKAAAPLLMGFTRKGLHFDTGFHYAAGLDKHGILRHWLKHLGVLEFLNLEQIYAFSEEFRLDDGKKYYFPAEAQKLLPSISKQFNDVDAKNFSKLLEQIRSVLANSAYTNPHCFDLPSLSFENNPSFLEKLEEFTFSPKLLQMIKAPCLLYGLDPKQASFHSYALVAGLYFESSHGIIGGGKKLANAFLQALAKQNIKIRCKAAVKQILHENKTLSAVKLHNDEIITAQSCIFTGHPTQLATLVPQGIFRQSFLEHIQNLPESAYAFIVFGISEKPYVSRRAVYLLPNQNNVINAQNSNSPSAYIIGGEKDNQAAQGHPFMAIIPQKENFFENIKKPRPQEYLQTKALYTQKIHEYLSNKVPELGQIQIVEAATPATMQDWIYGCTGSLYGVAHEHSSLPILPMTRMKNLYLAGQNILLPGILGGIVSAALGVGFVTDHAKVLQNFRQNI